MMKVTIFLASIMATCSSPKRVTNLNSFYFNNCGLPAWPIDLAYFNIRHPHSISIPGDVTVDVTVVATVPVVSPAPGNLILTYRSDDGTLVNIPCTSGSEFPFGSCHFEDSCSILRTLFPDPTNCPQAFKDVRAPCNCPLDAGIITLTGLTLSLDRPLSPLPSGEYNFEFSLFDSGGRQDGCINIGVNILFI